MPKNKSYSGKNVKRENSRTPKKVMGSQGKAAFKKILKKTEHFKNRPTGNKKFPGN